MSISLPTMTWEAWGLTLTSSIRSVSPRIQYNELGPSTDGPAASSLSGFTGCPRSVFAPRSVFPITHFCNIPFLFPNRGSLHSLFSRIGSAIGRGAKLNTASSFLSDVFNYWAFPKETRLNISDRPDWGLSFCSSRWG